MDNQQIFKLIMQYPKPGIPKAEKHNLIFLLKQQVECKHSWLARINNVVYCEDCGKEMGVMSK